LYRYNPAGGIAYNDQASCFNASYGAYLSYAAPTTACDGTVGARYVFRPSAFTCFPGSTTTAAQRNYGGGLIQVECS
jgi:hypothetical protein